MAEDFGWSGDEFLMGDCRDDWNLDNYGYNPADEQDEQDEQDENDWDEEDEILEEIEDEEDEQDFIRYMARKALNDRFDGYEDDD